MNNSVCLLDRDIDLYLSMSWYPGRPHGISGHVYEIIDYYLLLCNHFKVGILFGDTFNDWDSFKKAIQDKYELTLEQLEDIKKHTTFVELPKLVRGRNILFVDGSLKRLEMTGVKLSFKNIFVFKCSYKDTIYDVYYPNVTLFQDDRVYKDSSKDLDISINYKKKINFKNYKKINCNVKNTGLIYVTTNCRRLDTEALIDIMNSYKFHDYIIITNNVDMYKCIESSNVTVHEVPVNGLFNMFSTYIYTPTENIWDGSPRFLVECKFYGKGVQYYNITDQYLKIDAGLRYRKDDIENDFKSLFLNDNDEIIPLINEKIRNS